MNGHGTMLSESLLPGRDLGAAREAFVTRDAEASRTAHETTEAPEMHQTGGEHVKTIVFGGLDGILTAHAVIAAAVGAKLAPGHVLALGVSNVLADALSMGVGEYLSARSYNNYVQHELNREKWELENYPEGEVREMVNLYVAKGMSEEDAAEVGPTLQCLQGGASRWPLPAASAHPVCAGDPAAVQVQGDLLGDDDEGRARAADASRLSRKGPPTRSEPSARCDYPAAPTQPRAPP